MFGIKLVGVIFTLIQVTAAILPNTTAISHQVAHSSEESIIITSPTKVQKRHAKPLTNAERMSAGMLPAFPKVLERTVPLRTRKQYKRNSKRQDPAPSGGSTTPPTEPAQLTATDLASTDDDNVFSRALAFPVQIFDRSSSTLYISTNGLLSINAGTSSLSNSALPTTDTNIPSYAVMPFWEDLYYYETSGGGVSFRSDDTSFNLRYYGTSLNEDGVVDINVYYTTSNPGIFYTYYNSDNTATGSEATIGAQGKPKYVQYDYRAANSVGPGTTLVTNGDGSVTKSGSI
ncbi:uncharacterized protein IL334_007633 [Kwoniella shivajii]|uniref:Uncharacterized protein n=1 Tax=Kwoniella shivajii TaxID=564305 RepID=A0ABZ1D9S0_9TREE|nr:hypothetical protein IL334_007633 [Kwoniella shivajii]